MRLRCSTAERFGTLPPAERLRQDARLSCAGTPVVKAAASAAAAAACNGAVAAPVSVHPRTRLRGGHSVRDSSNKRNTPFERVFFCNESVSVFALASTERGFHFLCIKNGTEATNVSGTLVFPTPEASCLRVQLIWTAVSVVARTDTLKVTRAILL